MSKLNILLVDDNASDVELTMHALKKQGYSQGVRVFRDGVEALAFLQGGGDAAATQETRDVPRLILLDLKLPKLDGLEVLERIRGDERTKGIPVVVLTSSKEERDVVAAYRLGANSYVVKPVDFLQFSGAVGQIGAYWISVNQALTD